MTSPLAFERLTLGYDGHPAVHGLTGVLTRGSLTAIVGANGSGKSTLLKAAAGLLSPIAGAIRREDGCRIAYLPQQAGFDRAFPARVVDLVVLGLWPRVGAFGRIGRSERAAVEAAIHEVGLDGFGRRPLDTLSGGQLQRALFARMAVQDADILLLDEPFNAVDVKTVGDLVTLIEGWHRQGRTIVAVLHDLDLVRRHFPETLLLARRPVAWGSTDIVLAPPNLARARAFQEAWDDAAPWCDGHADDAPAPPDDVGADRIEAARPAEAA